MKELDDLLKLERVSETCPIMYTTLPTPIIREMWEWMRECRKIKDHPLSVLKSHENAGYELRDEGLKFNSYQCSIPPHLVEKSYWLAWILRLVGKYYHRGSYNHRGFRLRRYPGHFDAYDVWMNFAYKGDSNPIHNHAGYLSGVVYIKNDKGEPTIFPGYNVEYNGAPGTMVLFPSQKTMHGVDEKMTRNERVTMAFNIEKTNWLKSGEGIDGEKYMTDEEDVI